MNYYALPDPQGAVPSWPSPIDIKVFFEDTYVPSIGMMVNFMAEVEVHFADDDYRIRCARIHSMNHEGDYAPMVGECDLFEGVLAGLLAWVEKSPEARKQIIEDAETTVAQQGWD